MRPAALYTTPLPASPNETSLSRSLSLSLGSRSHNIAHLISEAGALGKSHRERWTVMRFGGVVRGG